jgi:hypothetical protein
MEDLLADADDELDVLALCPAQPQGEVTALPALQWRRPIGQY